MVKKGKQCAQMGVIVFSFTICTLRSKTAFSIYLREIINIKKFIEVKSKCICQRTYVHTLSTRPAKLDRDVYIYCKLEPKDTSLYRRKQQYAI